MYHFFVRLTFLIGFFLGVYLGYISVILLNSNSKILQASSKYDKWFAKNELKRSKVSLDHLRYGNTKYYLEAQYLYDKIKILCVILVKNTKNADAAKNTWTKSCNNVKYIKIEKKTIVPVGRKNLAWSVLCNELIASSAFDWVLVVNDTTFAILENLRLMVAHLNVMKNYYLGHAVTFWTTKYNLERAGYVLSRGTLNTLNISQNACTPNVVYLNKEDFHLGKLLSTLNIFPEDTRDSQGLSTFHALSWQQEFIMDSKYYKTSVYPVLCCSAQAVTFQASQPQKMYTFYYLLYQLQIFTHGYLGNSAAPTPVPQKEVWQAFLKERGLHQDYVSAQEYYKIWEDFVHDPAVFGREIQDKKFEFR